MSSKSALARVESIVQKIEDIEFVIERHGGIMKALEDREGLPAILMLIEAMAEQFHKLESKNGAHEILAQFDPVSIRGIHAARNFIAHDYDGVDLGFVESGLRELSGIKEICLLIIKQLS